MQIYKNERAKSVFNKDQREFLLFTNSAQALLNIQIVCFEIKLLTLWMKMLRFQYFKIVHKHIYQNLRQAR